VLFEGEEDMKNRDNRFGVLAALVALLAGTFASYAQPAQNVTAEEEALVGTLTSGAEPFEKDKACRRLAVIGTARAVPALAALLADDQLTGMARHALLNIPDAAAGEALCAALPKLTGTKLIGVISTIGRRGESSAVKALAPFIASPDDEVAATAARAIGRIGGGDSRRVLESALAMAPRSRRAAVAEGCIEGIRALTDRGATKDALALADTVRRSRVPAYLVAAATRAAVLLRGEAGALVLARQLDSPEPELFQMALLLTREAPGAAITRAVSERLGRLPVERQAPLLAALGDRGDAGALPVVLAAVDSTDGTVRVAALKALAQLGNGSAVPVLLAAASSENASEAEAAQIALATLPGDDVDTAVLEALSAGDARVRRIAIEAAGQRRLVEANPALLKAMDDADGSIRSAAIAALGQTTGPDGLTALVDVLLSRTSTDELGQAESAVASAFSRVADKRVCASALTAAMARAEVAPRCALIRLTGAAPTDEALGAVRAALRDGQAEVRAAAFRVLCDWATPAAAPDLLELARGGPDTERTAALRGYMRLIGSPDLSPEQKMAMCNEASALCRTTEDIDALLSGLATVASLDALNMAMSHLDNAPLTNKVSFAAVCIGELLEQKHPAEVAAAMERVLKAMNNPGMERRVRSCMERAQKAAGQ